MSKQIRRRQEPREMTELPDLTSSPEALEKVDFATERYKTFAQILQRLAVLENTVVLGRRLLETASVAPENRNNPRQREINQAKLEMHNLLLKKHSFPSEPRLIITNSDMVFDRRSMHANFEFRDEDAANLAHVLRQIVAYQHELNGHLENRGDYDEPERRAMIEDTTYRLRADIDHMMNILTGGYETGRIYKTV